MRPIDNRFGSAICGAASLLIANVALAQTPTSPSASPPDLSPPPAEPMPVGWGPHGKKLYYFMVFGNATPGSDAELNRWYDAIHAPMMIERGDFVWAQRFMLSPEQFVGKGNPELMKRRYMVIFAIETNDIKAAAADANKRMMSPRNVASPSLDYKTLTSITFEALGPAITQAQAQRMLKQEETKGTIPKVGQPAPPGSRNPFTDKPDQGTTPPK